MFEQTENLRRTKGNGRCLLLDRQLHSAANVPVLESQPFRYSCRIVDPSPCVSLTSRTYL